MSEITEVKVVEGQDESTTSSDTKVTVSISEPKEEVWTIDMLNSRISECEVHKQNALNNYNSQIGSLDEMIAKYQAIIAEVEKVLISK